MQRSALAILLTAIVAFHAAFGGVAGTAVLCLGGGHQHAPAEAEHCESACSHDAAWPLPVPADQHDRDCNCTDVELAIAELLTLPRGDDRAEVPPAMVSAPAWGVVVAKSGLGRRGPPIRPPWFDPRGVHRLAIVSSVRLNM
jgi:hypothetical protein